MRKFLSIVSLLLLGGIAFTGCKKDDKHGHDDHDDAGEYRYVRLLVSDATTSQISYIDAREETTENFTAEFPNAALYSTSSKRFGALLFGNQNSVRFFDCGLEYHGDHVDVKGTPKFAAMTADAPKPTHFKSRNEEVLIFNDGDGTLSIASENDLHNSGAKMEIINPGLAAHHGAMAQFDNGLYAVTFTDPTSADPGPHGVKVIDRTGSEVHSSSIAVSRLHGNATDGMNALFGVAGGILVVSSNGEQRIISNPSGFGDIRIGTVLEADGAGKFIGFTAARGAYLIDIVSSEITPILEATDIMQCKVDYAGNKLLILSLAGQLRIFDLSAMTLVREGKVIGETSSSATIKPIMEASTKYVYITQPETGEVAKINVNDLSEIKKIKVSPQPSRLAILGFETNESH